MATAVLLKKVTFFKMAQTAIEYLGYFCKQICCQELSKIDHTAHNYTRLNRKHLPTASQCCCLHKQARIIFEWFFGSSIHRFLASPCSSKPWEKQKKQQINLNLNKKIVNSFFQIIRWRLCFKLWWIIFK